LRHLLFLQHINSPFVSPDAKGGTLEDLEKAVVVCSSRSFSEIAERLSPASLGILARFRRIAWHRLNRSRDLNAGVLKFLCYLGDFVSFPIFGSSDEQESNCPFPSGLLYLAAMAKHTGWAEEEILSIPFGRIVWYVSAFGYLNTGETSVISDKEEQVRKLLEGLTTG